MVTPFSSEGELGIVWQSSPDSVGIGRFKSGVWQASRLTESLDYQTMRRTELWDGERWWTVLYASKKFVAFTAD